MPSQRSNFGIRPAFHTSAATQPPRCEGFRPERTSTRERAGSLEIPHAPHWARLYTGNWIAGSFVGTERSDVQFAGVMLCLGLVATQTGASASDGSSSFASHEVARRGSARTDLTRCHGNRRGFSLRCLLSQAKVNGCRCGSGCHGCHGHRCLPAITSRKEEADDGFVRNEHLPNIEDHQ